MRPLVFLISILATTSAACSGSRSQTPITAPAAGSASVQASPQLTFSPAEADIAVGGAVAWTFGSVAHNVTFQQGSDDAASYYGGQASTAGAPDDIPTSKSTVIARTFSRAGSYHYRCTIHPSMTGEVRVR